MKLRCYVREDQWITVTRFINGLKEDLKRDVALHAPETFIKTYQKALEFEVSIVFLHS